MISQAPKPNNIFIVADDLGLDGVGFYGSDKHTTPNIDKLEQFTKRCGRWMRCISIRRIDGW